MGAIGGIPRLQDLGQCNDACPAMKIARTLAEDFKPILFLLTAIIRPSAVSLPDNYNREICPY
jgi:hypothetical protein